MNFFIDSRLKVKNGKKGLGVYAISDIDEDAIIEVSPFSSCWLSSWEKTPENLKKIVFSYPIGSDNYVIGLGYLSIYNHDDNNNANWNSGDNCLTVKTCKKINKDEEICIHYGDAYWSGGWPKY